MFLLVIALSGWVAKDLRFEHERSRFFPAENEDLEFTTRFFSEIEQDDIFVLVGLEFEQSVLDSNTRIVVDGLSNQLGSIDLVDQSLSITNFKRLKKGGPRVYAAPLLSPHVKAYREIDSLRILKNPYVLENLVSKDFRSTNILLKTEVIKSQEMADALYGSLIEVLDQHESLNYHLSGFPVMQSVTVAQLAFEMKFYVSLAALLLVLILIIVYRSLLGIVVPLMSLVGGLAIFFAYIGLTGQSLDLMSSLYPILMLIFLMADVVHLQTHYMDQLSMGNTPKQAMEVTVKEIGMALFLTSFTTAVGFGALATSRIEAIRFFGLNAAVGVLIAFAVVMVFAASLLLFFTKSRISSLKGQSSGWSKVINRIFLFNKSQYKTIVIATLVAVVLAAVGISKISTNAFIKGDLPENTKIRDDFEFFETQFGGVRSLEMAVLPAADLDLNQPEVLIGIARLEQYLADSQNIRNIVSPTIPYRALNNAFSRGRKGFDFPEEILEIKKFRGYLGADTTSRLKSLMNKEGTLGRISGRQTDFGSDFHENQNTQIKRWVDGHIDPDVVDFRITGTTLMFDRNHRYLRLSLFRSLGLAFVIVGFLFALLFRDYRMVLVSLIPNVLPMLLAAAVMGFLGIKLQALTSIFFAISFGIAVDDTIHFLTRYKLERKKGKTVDKAIKTTLEISGKAIIITSIILIVSFFTLTLSDFKGTYYIGVLVSITLLTAVLADLFLLPQLLYFINRRIIKEQRKESKQVQQD